MKCITYMLTADKIKELGREKSLKMLEHENLMRRVGGYDYYMLKRKIIRLTEEK